MGENGSGKTTLAKLFLNLYQVEEGESSLCDQIAQDIQLELLAYGERYAGLWRQAGE